MVEKCTKLVKARDAERLRERDEEEAAAAEEADKASSDENKENDEGSAETPAKESDKPISKLDGGAMSAEKMD